MIYNDTGSFHTRIFRYHSIMPSLIVDDIVILEIRLTENKI